MLMAMAACAALSMSLPFTVDAAPLKDVIRGEHSELPGLCDLPGQGYKDGAFWTGCVNRHTGKLVIYKGMRHDQFVNVYNALLRIRAAGANTVLYQRKFTVFFDGAAGWRQYCEGHPNATGC
jgi:hypothetical protein